MSSPESTGGGRVAVTIDGDVVNASVVGPRGYGAAEVLLEQDDNLIAGTAWSAIGYTVAPFLTAEQNRALGGGITDMVEQVVTEIVGRPIEGLTLDRYHDHVPSVDVHKMIVARTAGGVPVADLPVPVALLERRVSDLCGVEVTADAPYLESPLFYVRIVRPAAVNTDNNPPHRDVWLAHLRNCVNIYVPLAGSDERSSLPLIPGSHLWPESEIERTLGGATVEGQEFRVPSVTRAAHPLAMTRPNPGPDEFMVFSPYLVHGGGVNLNPDTTRVSLEMRFWRAGRTSS